MCWHIEWSPKPLSGGSIPFTPASNSNNGAMAEWLSIGLQNRPPGFDSPLRLEVGLTRSVSHEVERMICRRLY